jgi:NAD(P)-dependent dehydrogenase (short-subunit alcohol dehydrogenase family)
MFLTTFMKTLRKTVLVAGSQGVIGRAAAEHFSKEADTTVYAVSRRPLSGLKTCTQSLLIYWIRETRARSLKH